MTDAQALGARPGEQVPDVSGNGGLQGPLQVPPRLLMGPGPSNAHPRVLAAQGLPLLGHLHPPFLAIMDEIKKGLQYLFQTSSPYTCLISGTGHAGMEAAIANLLEPGEKILVGSTGIWGTRAADIATRYGAEVVELKAEPGHSLATDDIKAALQQHKPAVLFLCQGESSSGVQQSLAGMGEACEASGTLLLVDSVCTLGGAPLFCDAWGVDCTCAAPFMLSERAYKKVLARKTQVASWYFDVKPLGEYWGWTDKPRFYHHTGTVSAWYGLREAIAIASGEGLQALWTRHQKMQHAGRPSADSLERKAVLQFAESLRQVHSLLWEGLASLGLRPFVEDPADRLATVNTIRVPEGVDFLKLNQRAMEKYGLEIAGGLGPTAGKVWRIGVMGYNATPANIAVVIEAFRDGLQAQGYRFPSV